MDNYQLYRSNISLGGQMKWDICIESFANDADEKYDGLVVNSLGLSPLSDTIKCQRGFDDTLLNNDHLLNIKNYHNTIEGSFFNTYADPILTSSEPIISEDKSERVYLHNNILDMGLRRAKYSIYKKQFEYFCPLWLENYNPDTQQLGFKFSVNIGNRVVTKILTLGKHVGSDIHNRFVDYLNKYIKDIELDDRLIKVDFNNKAAFISGVNAKTGLYTKSKDISILCDNLLSSERLLLETDNLIIQNFKDNHLIAKQLFNFNFIFDIDEFIVSTTLSEIYGSNVNMNIEAYIIEDGVWTKLDRKDFYTNYDNIKCRKVGVGASTSDINDDEQSGIKYYSSESDVNILDEIADNRNVDIIDKNKITQNILHWSLVGDNDYIFNIYTGFGGVLKANISEGSEEEYNEIIPTILSMSELIEANEGTPTIKDPSPFMKEYFGSIDGYIDWDDIEKRYEELKDLIIEKRKYTEGDALSMYSFNKSTKDTDISKYTDMKTLLDRIDGSEDRNEVYNKIITGE